MAKVRTRRFRFVKMSLSIADFVIEGHAMTHASHCASVRHAQAGERARSATTAAARHCPSGLPSSTSPLHDDFASGPQIPKLSQVEVFQDSRHVAQGRIAARADLVVKTGPRNLNATGWDEFRGGSAGEEGGPAEAVPGVNPD